MGADKFMIGFFCFIFGILAALVVYEVDFKRAAEQRGYLLEKTVKPELQKAYANGYIDRLSELREYTKLDTIKLNGQTFIKDLDLSK